MTFVENILNQIEQVRAMGVRVRYEVKRILSDETYLLLEDYTNWLCKHGYTDADVYAEEPKAVDAYLEELKKKK